MNTQKWQSRLQVGDVKQCPQSVPKRQKSLALRSSSGRGLLVSKGGWGREKIKCVVDDGEVKDGNRRSRLHCALNIFRLLHIFIISSGWICGGENKTPFSLEIDSWLITLLLGLLFNVWTTCHYKNHLTIYSHGKNLIPLMTFTHLYHQWC